MLFGTKKVSLLPYNWQKVSVIIVALVAGSLFTYVALQDMGGVYGGSSWYDALSGSFPTFAFLLYSSYLVRAFESGGQYAIQLGPHAIFFGAAFWVLVDAIAIILLAWIPRKFSQSNGEAAVFKGAMLAFFLLPILFGGILYILSLTDSSRMFIEFGVQQGSSMGISFEELAFLIYAGFWGVFLTIVNFLLIVSSVVGGKHGWLMRTTFRM